MLSDAVKRIGPIAHAHLMAGLFAACATGCSGMPEVERAEARAAERARNELVAFMSLETMFPEPRLRALAKAAGRGNVRRIDALVREGVDVNGRGTSGAVPLFWAMHDIRGFRRLLELGANPNAVFEDGGSVMHWAVTLKDAEFLLALLEHGADPELRAGALDRTPLFEVIIYGLKPRVPILLEAGANIDARDAVGWTPVMTAASNEQFALVYDLLQRGADYSATTAAGLDLADVIASSHRAVESRDERTDWRHRVTVWLERRGVEIE